MTESYYGRKSVLHIDGTPMFQNEEDRNNEAMVAERLGQCWRCEMCSFGALSPVDWYAVRHGRLVGLAELKTRPHAHDRYATAFLNVRKWLALVLGAVGLGVPAVYVIQFKDGLFWVPLSRIDARRHRIGGCLTLVKSVNDIEPIIEVELGDLTRIKDR